jgi:hypothetical protein
MRRVLVGVCVGAVCGVLALAGCGAWGGYTHGWARNEGSRRPSY